MRRGRYDREDSRGSRGSRYSRNSGSRGRDSKYSSHGGRYSSNGRSSERYNSRRGDYNQSDAGNKRERIAIESGSLVLIDQFMLANPQFIEKMLNNIDEDASVKNDIIRDYGGEVVDITPDTYGIQRDPYALSIIIHPSDMRVDKKEISSKMQEPTGNVFVDTRCIAMIDRELLDDNSLLKKYQELWESGEDKACRDLLRDNGGAVRYGFCRYGDEFNVYVSDENNIVCLWPGVAENLDE